MYEPHRPSVILDDSDLAVSGVLLSGSHKGLLKRLAVDFVVVGIPH